MLCRSQIYGVFNTKNTSPLQLPDQLDVSDFLLPDSSVMAAAGVVPDLGTKYRLAGLSNHMGGLGSGHYTAHIKVNCLFSVVYVVPVPLLLLHSLPVPVPLLLPAVPLLLLPALPAGLPIQKGLKSV